MDDTRDNGTDRDAAVRAMLGWYVDAGADEAILDSPVDRFAAREPADAVSARQPAASAPPNVLAEAPQRFDAPAQSPPAPPAPAARPAPAPLQSRDAAVRTAQEIAAAANTIEELREAFAAFDGCPLRETATTFVFADGKAGAKLMFVGEAPGAEEDRQGVPFVGPAGRLLDKMLAAVGLDRSDAYITNILPWRPPGNRNPTDAEIAACLPFVERHIALVAPSVLVFVGGTAAKTLMRRQEGIMRMRGRWLTYEPSDGPAVPARALLHPAYLLRQPAQKRETWADLLDIRDRLRMAENGGN